MNPVALIVVGALLIGGGVMLIGASSSLDMQFASAFDSSVQNQRTLMGGGALVAMVLGIVMATIGTVQVLSKKK